MQVRTGQELKTAEKCRARIVKPGEDVFVMQGERMFKTSRGMEKRLYGLFKSYVFVETEDIDDFWMRLRSMKVITKVLTTGDTMTPMWISMVTTVAIRIPLAYGIAWLTRTPEFPKGRYECIWISLLFSWVLGAVITIVFYRLWNWKKKALSLVKEKE